MAATDPLAGEIREDRLAAGYVFYGEEDYLAEEFIRRLKRALISPDAQGFNLERFDLAVVRWPDIIDTARTAPFFFSPWRIVVVRAVEENREGKEAREGKGGSRKLSSLDEKILREYFHSPASRTVLVVVISGRVKKTHPLVKFFDSLPRGAVVLKEVRPLKKGDLHAWMMQRLAPLGKSATPEALGRLEEVAGSDLRRIDRELEKIAAFAADRKTVDIEDVLQVCDWTKSFIEWDLAEALKRTDQRQSLLILNRAFQEGVRPEHILRVLANFFRDLLLAKLWLREGRDRKEIFAFLKPQIKEAFVKLYADEFKALFSLLERLSIGEINWAVRELEKIDFAIKTMDVSEQPLMETFVIEYCRRQQQPRDRRSAIWKEKG
jgi:DNA polymerase III delta subunit